MNMLTEVLSLLDLKSEPNSVANLGISDCFEAENIYIPTNRVYGGQFLAQAIVATTRTTSEYRLPHSIHSYFLKSGQLDHKLHYQVQRLHDGVSFSNREVSAYQSNQLLFRSMVSFQESELSEVDFSTTYPKNVPEPTQISTIEEVFAVSNQRNIWADYFKSRMPFEIRQISPSLFLASDTPDQLPELTWVRLRESDVSDLEPNIIQNQVIQRSLLTFASDQFAFSPALRANNLNWLRKGASYVSLDHTQYIHRNIDLTQWHLFVGNSPAGANARGVGITTIFNSEQEVVSTIIQEGLIRTGGNNTIRF